MRTKKRTWAVWIHGTTGQELSEGYWPKGMQVELRGKGHKDPFGTGKTLVTCGDSLYRIDADAI